MKKIIALSLLLLTVIGLLAGCRTNKTQAVLDVEALIEAVPEEITPETGEALSAARAAYDALSEEEQPQVKGRKQLEKLEGAYLTFMDVKNYVSVITSVEAGNYDKTTMFSDLLERAEEIKNSYKKLPADQQAQIKGADRIDEALPVVQSYVDNAATGAVNYVSAFLQLYQDKNDTVTAVYCNKQPGSDKEELHFYALTYQDEKGGEHTVYSNARFSHEVSPAILLTRPETFFAQTAPSGDNDPVTFGNVELDAAAITAEARKLPAPKTATTTQTETTTAPTETTTA